MPTAKLPKSCTIGRKKERQLDAENAESSDEDDLDEMGRRGQILWIRGLTRLQHQVSQHSLLVLVHPPFIAPTNVVTTDHFDVQLICQHWQAWMVCAWTRTHAHAWLVLVSPAVVSAQVSLTFVVHH